MIVEAFLLGISSGSYCVFNCAPVATPLFLKENMTRKENFRRLLLFLSGRLAGYLLFGYIIGLTGAYALGYFDPYIRIKLESVTMIILGLCLLISGIEFKNKRLCSIKKLKANKRIGVITLGLLTGLSFCPPFFVAAGRVFGTTGSLGGLIYFLFFFIGTSIFLLPFGGFFLFSRFKSAVSFMGKYLRIMIGLYFLLFLGLLNLFTEGVKL